MIYQSVMGIHGVQLPPDPIQSEPNYNAALKAFQKLPEARILFDNGAGSSTAGAPLRRLRALLLELPPAQDEGQVLVPRRTAARCSPSASRRPAASRSPGTRPPGRRPTSRATPDRAGLWTATPNYDWEQSPAGSAASYLSPKLTADTTVVGAGYLQAWIKSSKPDVDLQATISEVRPDGKETFVQSGWLRASDRKLDRKKSTPLEPVLSLRKSDVAPLPKGRWSKVTIPLYYEGHEYRSGSRIRVTIAPPDRRSAGLVVRRDRALEHREGDPRALGLDAVPADPSGGLGARGADRPPALPGHARRALPRLRAVREHRGRHTVAHSFGVVALPEHRPHLAPEPDRRAADQLPCARDPDEEADDHDAVQTPRVGPGALSFTSSRTAVQRSSSLAT